MLGWLNYYGIAEMKRRIEELNKWLYHRIRMCIWKQWKKPKTKVKNLLKLGVPEDLSCILRPIASKMGFRLSSGELNIYMTSQRSIGHIKAGISISIISVETGSIVLSDLVKGRDRDKLEKMRNVNKVL